MTGYILKRLLSIIPVLLVVAVVVFSITFLTPGDPASVILGPEASAQEVNKLREELGLNKPVHEQFLEWIGGLLRGDLGSSLFMRETVVEAFFNHLGPTFSLALIAQVIAILIAIPLGILAAVRRGTMTDQSVMGLSLVGISVPSFLLGLFLVLLLAVQLRWLPVAGYRPISAGMLEHLKYLIMPALALGAMQAALITRMTRSAMLDVFHQNYIKTAKSKGLKEKVVIYKHALRNASMPILTVIGQTFGVLVTGAAVIETVFNIPGLGQLIVNSVERRDYAVIQGVVLLIAVTYVLLNLVIDLLYGVLDPRIRLSRK
ncbi:ABC transporter permease [Bacillus horti]|uniref:Peptide/nickel transport system permease protein n=1 Tax=Caldalkalibacillus horti TaxID=77523 RepID=A0ABT9VV70_9BACI|nr:ABC transporter permease [Bacillus horti]MDQ0164886.1 peptide/nickel transport system permease protein [Bacillus horti]